MSTTSYDRSFQSTRIKQGSVFFLEGSINSCKKKQQQQKTLYRRKRIWNYILVISKHDTTPGEHIYRVKLITNPVVTNI